MNILMFAAEPRSVQSPISLRFVKDSGGTRPSASTAAENRKSTAIIRPSLLHPTIVEFGDFLSIFITKQRLKVESLTENDSHVFRFKKSMRDRWIPPQKTSSLYLRNPNSRHADYRSSAEYGDYFRSCTRFSTPPIAINESSTTKHHVLLWA
jgi:hypothetical protein